jgi:two-component sensor histidine kinase
VFWVSCGLLITIAALLRALFEALSASERRASVIAQEMQHRVKNVLGMAVAISYQAARSTHTAAEHHAIVETRLVALGRAPQTILGDPDASPDLRALINSVVEPFGFSHFDLVGPAITVPPDLCLGLALLIHELATNATKHGALSAPAGIVKVLWVSDGKHVRLIWKERGGPAVTAPTRTGFGSKLMRAVLPPDRSEVAVAFEPDGLKCDIHVKVESESINRKALPK